MPACVCVSVRQDGTGRRIRPPSRNALSAVFQREGAQPFFWFNLSFRTVLCSFLKLSGGDCLCFFIGVAGLYIVLSGSDEGSRAAQAASSWAEQTGESKRMDQELEPHVSHSENLYRTRFRICSCRSFLNALGYRYCYLMVSVQLSSLN
jgi:hypothetical protein